MKYAGFLVVEDESGTSLRLYEYRGWLFSKRRFVLETGEAVTRINFDSYKITKTGEALVRAKPSTDCVHEALTDRGTTDTNPLVANSLN
jgi:hypothetical protein